MKVSKAKAKLLLEYPFFGSLASKIEIVQNDDLQSFKTDGIKLEINSDFLDSLSTDELMSVLANGAMHITLEFTNRQQNRSSWLWQLAFDYAINDMLLSSGFVEFETQNYQKRFTGMYAEQIYALLRDEILRDELEYEGEDSKDTKVDEPQDDLADERLFGEEAKLMLDDELAKGEKLEYLERFFKLQKPLEINWRDELKSAITRDSKDNYTLLPPNKKFLYADIYLPSCVSEKFKLVVAIDSSGSIDEQLLGEFVSELNYLVLFLPNYELDVIVCDDRVRSHQKFYSGDSIEVSVSGGGATDFRAVFEFIDTHIDDVNLLLYFSDLDGVFPKYPPNYEVKWVSKNQKDTPFGEVIALR
ncbi:MAG: VWA-like domain-containing protein [Sulfurimonas sp.]|jgi:predicted metal-dependent peptidase|nr:VWA-like domain-containing protein [Sulfurimonadaceae bacterium]